MADGERTLRLDITISALALRHLEARAKKLGVTLSAAAAEVLELQLFDYEDYDWGGDPESDPRTAPAREETDEPSYPAECVFAEFRAELEKQLATKR
jgi:hypothetical protein